MTTSPLVFRAGPQAARHVRERGLRAGDVDTVAGAAGGPKWLVLSRLDRVIAPWLLAGRDATRSRGASRPISLVGSSIGSWRFAAWCQPDPIAALDRFEAAYIDQRYPASPSMQLVSKTSRTVLDTLLGREGARRALAHPTFRLSVFVDRGRHLLGASGARLQAGLLASAAANAVDRRLLRFFFERVLVRDPRSPSPLGPSPDLPVAEVDLTIDNLHAALMATVAIPLSLEGVRDIPGARRGTYRDGGVVDYHLDVPFAGHGLVLYPHFFDRIVPGWFDRTLRWRRARPAHVDRVLLVHPSAAFIERLPGRKIPDRRDFARLTNDDRVRAWRTATDACGAMADDLASVLASGDVADRLLPLHP